MSNVRFGVKEVRSTCEFIVALNDLNELVYVNTPVGLSQPEWENVPDLPDSYETKRFAGRIPILVDSEWVSAGVYNSATESGNAYAIYRDPAYDTIAVKEWSNRYPVSVSDDPVEGTSNAMPFGSVAANWGDYFLLGDIQWKEDPKEEYSDTNTARYPHGIWFSRPGAPDTFHPNDVFFIGQKLSDNKILGMFPLDVGLLIVSQSSISLLRGRPGPAAEDFVYEEIRTGISPSTRNEVTFWAETGLVVWVDRRGRVWSTNGEVVSQLNRRVEIPRLGEGCVFALDDALFVSGGENVRLLTSFGDSAAWTTLITPTGWRQAVACGSTVIGVGKDQDSDGTFTLDDPVQGLLGENTLHAFVDSIQVFDLSSPKRGEYNGSLIRPIVRTRPLPGASDRTAFWHRFGVRAEGDGKIVSATSYPSADVSERGYKTNVRGRLSDRKDWAFSGHGPSLEAVFEVSFEGDVSPEHFTIGAHRGRSKL
jgi:hypothetical protein